MIYENILKSIATALSECTATHENKASYNTDYIVPNLIDFFCDDWKEIRIKIENAALTTNWFLVNIFYDFLELHMEK